MSRPLRIEFPGALYHVTGRGNDRQDVFLSDEDCVGFINLLKLVNERFNWLCHAYCLMGNHYHLVLETPDGNLAQGMRQLGSVFTQAFNRRYGRVGHLFQGRYKSVLVQRESHLLEVVRYVVLNPARAGMVHSAADWPWSSYRATAGKVEPHGCLTTKWVLNQFSADVKLAQIQYQQFVAEGVAQESLWSHLKGRTILGSEDFIDRLSSILDGQSGCAEIPRCERLLNRPFLRQLFDEKNLSDKRLRNCTMFKAMVLYGYSQKEIADHLGLHYSTVSRLMSAETAKVKT